MEQVCALTKDGTLTTVMDAGGAFYGTSLCSTDEQAGWTNTGG